MNIWEYLVPLSGGICIGQLMAYLQRKTGKLEIDGSFMLRYIAIVIVLVIAVGTITMWLMPEEQLRQKVTTGIWIIGAALLYWRTRELVSTQQG